MHWVKPFSEPFFGGTPTNTPFYCSYLWCKVLPVSVNHPADLWGLKPEKQVFSISKIVWALFSRFLHNLNVKNSFFQNESTPAEVTVSLRHQRWVYLDQRVDCHFLLLPCLSRFFAPQAHLISPLRLFSPWEAGGYYLLDELPGKLLKSESEGFAKATGIISSSCHQASVIPQRAN